VVDDIPVNLRLLEAKLAAEYFHVLTAQTGPEALEKVRTERPDIVLLDIMMPGMDDFEVCRRLRAEPETAHVPVIMVTALSVQQDRVKGLEAGADDFLTKPIRDDALFARLRSLLRLKMVLDELRLREETSRALGVEPGAVRMDDALLMDGLKVAVVMDDAADAAEVCAILPKELSAQGIAAGTPAGLVGRIARAAPDLVILDLYLAEHDALRIAAELRSLEATRFSAILLLADQGDAERLPKALELGVNDYVMKPIDPSELVARARIQARYRRYRERLRGAYSESVNQAHTDALTGLFNRRYVLRHIENLRANHRSDNPPSAILMVDIDHFKVVNDSYGHDAGDIVMKEVAKRVSSHLRAGDVVARLGGEEFIVVLPAVEPATAMTVAERLRRGVAEKPFTLPDGERSIPVTVSVGVALDDAPSATLDALIKRADAALHQAKREGRNRVVQAAAVSAAA
jgi:two-component system cell cycle response regulator